MLYRFTYAISFAALVAATAGIADYWQTPKGIQGGVLFFLVPAILVFINAFGIEVCSSKLQRRHAALTQISCTAWSRSSAAL